MALKKEPALAKNTLLIIILLIVISGRLFSQSNEYLVKAAYIEKFARFTEWPARALEGKFIIAVLGKDPFEGALKEIAGKEKIKGLPIEVQNINDISELGRCHILFIAKERGNSLNQILSHLGSRHILTVSDSKDYSEKGIHFNFYFTDKSTIHFEVNPSSIKKSGLVTDIYLLQFGKKVGG